MINVAERTIGAPTPFLRAWRRHKLLKQTELAEAAQLSRFTVIKAEGGASISIDNIRKLAEALGITPDDLIHREPPA